VPFSTTLGSVSVTPTAVETTTAADSGSFDVTVESSIDLDGLDAEAFGLSQPATTQEPVAQNNPDDPSTASVKRDLTISHASRVTVTTELAANDIDLLVVHDVNDDGTFALDEIVASSASPEGDESVELVRPADGDYQVWIHGFQVAGTPSAALTIDPVQGNDMTASGLPDGPVPAGTAVTIHVDYAKTMVAGQSYFGELLLGPPSPPTALSVPVTVRRE
jgi:hypothetical protein